MKKLILKIYWGGLGDHLLYSPIPRLAKQKYGYDKVFISNKSSYRNPEVKSLVWELNPYVDGFSNEDADYPKFAKVSSGSNILDEVAVFYGLHDERTKLNEPEIYYEATNFQELNTANIFEPNTINRSGVPDISLVEEYFKNNNIDITHQMGHLFDSMPALENVPILAATTLQTFCDIVTSCKHMYCFTTGAATLAAALKKPTTVLYTSGVKPMFHHSKLHSYIKIG